MQDPAAARPPGPASPAARAALALVAAMVLLALWESGAALLAPRRVPAEADWAAAAAEVRAGFQPGDLIVFAPAWADPLGRLHLGDLIPPEMAARADDSAYRRIWEVSIRGARAPETLADSALPEAAHAHGRVRVALYSHSAPVVPLYDFVAHAAEARVVQVPTGPSGGSGRGGSGPGGALAPGDERPCLREAGAAFRCSTTRVERRTLEVDFTPRRGILAPADGTLTTRIEFPEVPLGNSLVGYTGIHDWHARKFGVGPVDFRVFVDGVQVLAERHGSGDGWSRFAVPTLRYAGSTRPVRFEISAPSGSRERTLGFAAWSRSEAPASPSASPQSPLP